MSKQNDGGPASVKSLRDEFAGQAMREIIAKSPHTMSPIDGGSLKEQETAAGAYSYADAMLAERDKETGL